MTSPSSLLEMNTLHIYRYKNLVHESRHACHLFPLPHTPANRNDIPPDKRATGLRDTRRTKAYARPSSGDSGVPDPPSKDEL